VEKALAAAKTRKPRLPLVDEAKAREVYGEAWTDKSMPQWARLLANFPGEGRSRAMTTKTAEEKGDLKPLLKAQVSWIIARQDRAWYATGLAKQKLASLGVSEDDIYKLDGSWDSYSAADRAMFTVARKLAASPVILTDADVDEAVKQSGPRCPQLVNLLPRGPRSGLPLRVAARGLRLSRREVPGPSRPGNAARNAHRQQLFEKEGPHSCHLELTVTTPAATAIV
jgi:hypothetical protein